MSRTLPRFVLGTIPGNGSAPGIPSVATNDSETFWFFNPDNVEMMVKVLDGRPRAVHRPRGYGGLLTLHWRA